MTITEDTLVCDIAAALPSSIRTFHRVGIDFCGGGKKPLAVACDERRLSFPAIREEIEARAAATRAEEHDWSGEPLHALAAHIEATYHARLREEFPRLEQLAGRALRVHGAKAPRLLGRLEAIVRELAADMIEHMRKEEQVLFPAIRALEAGAPLDRPVPLSAPFSIMEHEHDKAGDLIAELRTITNGFTPPEWGCETMRALYEELAAFERDMHVHVHLENNMLFPRALRLTQTGATA